MSEALGAKYVLYWKMGLQKSPIFKKAQNLKNITLPNLLIRSYGLKTLLLH